MINDTGKSEKFIKSIKSVDAREEARNALQGWWNDRCERFNRDSKIMAMEILKNFKDDNKK